jgi:putative ubiquitin-RnfH superfamily antitoxin RatB of RatAB toxin-antitoxin module
VSARLAVKVAYSPRAGAVDEAALMVPADAVLLDALRSSGVLERHPEIDLGSARFGIWGQLRALDAALRDGDRIEVYRPLQVDPMEARRLRQRRQQATCSRRK